jgi:hypothetical protein
LRWPDAYPLSRYFLQKPARAFVLFAAFNPTALRNHACDVFEDVARW